MIQTQSLRAVKPKAETVDRPGLVLFEPVRDEHHQLADLRVRWANSSIQLLFETAADWLQTGCLLSRWADDPTSAPARLYSQLRHHGEQPVFAQTPAGRWIQIRLTPLEENMLALVEPVVFPPDEELGTPLAIALHHQQLKQSTETLEQRVSERTAEIQQLSFWQSAILEHAGIGIVGTDATGLIQTVNPALEKMLGYEAWELLGKLNPFQLYETPELIRQAQALSIEIGQPVAPGYEAFAVSLELYGRFQSECTLITKTGGLLPILLTASLMHDETGQITGCASMITDISRLKETEKQLRHANRRLRLATQAGEQGVWEYDIKQDQLIWDEQMYAIHGLQPATFGGRMQDFMAIVHPDDRATFQQTREQNQKHDQPLTCLVRILRPDGAVRYSKMSRIVIHDNDRPSRIIGVAWDVTTQQLAAQALCQSEQQFREIAENVNEIFWSHTVDPFQLLYLNPAYEQIWGHSIESLRIRPLSFLQTVVKHDRPRVWKGIKQYLKGIEIEFSFQIQRPDGRRWILVRTRVVRNDQGIPVRYIGIAHDITDQKEAELALRSSLRRAKELNKLKTQFVSTASHQFRTPLATIQTSIDLIQIHLRRSGTEVAPSCEKHLKIIEQEVERFSNLLNDILSIGKIDAGKITPRYQPVDVLQLCADLIDTHFRTRSDGRTVQVSVEGSPAPLLLDYQLMTHALLNLLSNAFKFSTSNPRLRICFRTDGVHLSVEDDGIGIPKDDFPHLFQSFFRARNAGSVQGTGLGLVITRQFVELHQGTLHVESQEGRGTQFTIKLPLQ